MDVRDAATLVGCFGAVLLFTAPAAQAQSPFSRTGGSFDDRFVDFDGSRWQRSDGWSNGGYMGCAWNAANLSADKGRVALSITDQPSKQERYSCAELRTWRHYGFGSYTVRLKAAKADGVITTVSHYTGPPFGDPWDEITLGIAGKDTTRLEISHVARAIGYRGTVIDLGFDAAKEFHTYGFEWKPESITWTVDGRPVHTVHGKAAEIPQSPGRIYVQLWNGSGDTQWLHRFQYPGKPLVAEVARVTFREDAASLNN